MSLKTGEPPMQVLIDDYEENPNGALKILKVGDYVTIREPFGGHDHGMITKIGRRNREGVLPVYVMIRYTKTTRKVPSWYIEQGWH
jgi:hypothetical protein